MKMANKIALFCIMIGILAIAGTTLAEEPELRQPGQNETGKTVTDELPVRKPAQDEIGKMATCPVTNEKFEITKSTPVIDYKGRSYYFCCSPCVDYFKKNLDKYAK